MKRWMCALAMAFVLPALPAAARTKQYYGSSGIRVLPDQGYVLARIGPVNRHHRSLDIGLARIDPASGRLRTIDRNDPMRLPHGEDEAATLGGLAFIERADTGDAGTGLALTRVTPGEYVILSGGGTCLCMGSYRFTVRPGEITDIGTIMAIEDDSELGQDTDRHNTLALARVTITPPEQGSAAPPVVAAFPRHVAELVFTRFDNERALLVGRMEGLPAMGHETPESAAAVADRNHAWGTAMNRWPDIAPTVQPATSGRPRRYDANAPLSTGAH